MYLKPQGYALIVDPGGRRLHEERDVFKCAHCGKIVHVTPMCDPAEMGGRCTHCEDGLSRGLICKDCVGKPCDPFMKRIEQEEARAQLRRML